MEDFVLSPNTSAAASGPQIIASAITPNPKYIVKNLVFIVFALQKVCRTERKHRAKLKNLVSMGKSRFLGELEAVVYSSIYKSFTHLHFDYVRFTKFEAIWG